MQVTPGYSKDALSKLIGLDRRTVDKIIQDHGIAPVSAANGKDGRKLNRFQFADVAKAHAPHQFENGANLATALGYAMLHPENPLIAAILRHLPKAQDPAPALVEIIEAGWDTVDQFLGYEPGQGRNPDEH